MAIRASWLVLSLLLVFALAATAMGAEEGALSPSEEGAASPAADEEAADGAPAPGPASEEEASLADKLKAKGKTVLASLQCKIKGNCPDDGPAPEAADAV